MEPKLTKEKLQVKVYTPDSQIRNPGVFIRDLFADISKSQGLALQLAIRDIRTQYRQSFLGILWAFVLPLANTITWIFLNKTGVVKLDSTEIPYPLYVFSGTLLWSIFMESMQSPLKLTNAAKGILSKINFPREAIIFSGIYQSIFNGVIKIMLIVFTFMIFNIYPGWTLILFPIAFISLVIAGTTVGLLATPIGMLYTDIGKAIPLIMQFVMYITPVVFPIPKQGWAYYVFTYNPLTQIIMVCRDWLAGNTSMFSNGFLVVNVIMIGLLFFALIIYKSVMPIIIERMNA
jgi:lipopolysaccharide transport system permease protein